MYAYVIFNQHVGYCKLYVLYVIINYTYFKITYAQVMFKLWVGYFKLRVGYFAWLNQSNHSFKLR